MKKTVMMALLGTVFSTAAFAAAPPPPQPKIVVLDKVAILQFSKVGQDVARQVQGYAAREDHMRRARLEPELPPWPNACFYPMNKKRKVGENWFALPWAERSRLMAEHGRTGMTFGGRVTQLITVSVGLDDWEWGVTLWARRPEFLKEIVYTMRFDEASARYAEFGPFYTGYISTPAEILAHCHIA